MKKFVAEFINCTVVSEETVSCNGSVYNFPEKRLTYHDEEFWIYIGIYTALVMTAGECMSSVFFCLYFFLLLFPPFQCCFTSTEAIRLFRNGDPRTATSTFTQLLSSDPVVSKYNSLKTDVRVSGCGYIYISPGRTHDFLASPDFQRPPQPPSPSGLHALGHPFKPRNHGARPRWQKNIWEIAPSKESRACLMP